METAQGRGGVGVGPQRARQRPGFKGDRGRSAMQYQKVRVQGNFCSPSLVRTMALPQQVVAVGPGGRPSWLWPGMTKAEREGGSRSAWDLGRVGLCQTQHLEGPAHLPVTSLLATPS